MAGIALVVTDLPVAVTLSDEIPVRAADRLRGALHGGLPPLCG